MLNEMGLEHLAFRILHLAIQNRYLAPTQKRPAFVSVSPINRKYRRSPSMLTCDATRTDTPPPTVTASPVSVVDKGTTVVRSVGWPPPTGTGGRIGIGTG